MSHRQIGVPGPDEHAAFHTTYISLVPGDDPVAAMEAQFPETLAIFAAIPEERGSTTQPPYTWTFKQVIGHMTDAERVFGYRTLRFARGDTTPLPGFEEGHYVEAAHSDSRTIADLAEEFAHIRRANLALFRSLDDGAWLRRGTANGGTLSVRALAYITAGHERHHAAILKKRLQSLA